MKKIIGAIVTLAIVGLMVFLLAGNKKKMQEQTSSNNSSDLTEVVSVYTVKEESMCRSFSSNAMVQALTELNFVSDVTGRVTELFVDKGATVQPGTPLLKIDSDLIEADYAAALAAYNAMKKDEERFTRSNAAGGISDQQLDNIRAQVQASESRLAYAQWKKDNSIVKSPMRGTINLRYVELGSLIAPNAPLFEIVDASKMKVLCMVPESKVKMVEKGQKVTASETGTSATFTGTVKNVGVKTDRGLNYPVEVILDKSPELRIGMYLNVHFTESEERPIVLIPRKAISGSAMAANVYLAVDGKAVRREVVLGEMYGNDIEITEGLSAGESVIVSGIMNVAYGTPIRIVE